MARTRQNRPPRNTAPMWKKLAVVLSAPVAVIVVVRLLNATTWSFLFFLALVIVVAAAVVWLMAKLLGVHLSLSSWD
ncbi:MAG TPA: hypothetical protein VIL79_12690 [Thermoleophilia bacterium]